MIISFDIKNYLSFQHPASVDLSVGVSAPDNYHFLDNPSARNRVAKIAGFYGANASGKTNIVRALAAMADFVSESFSYKLDDATPFRAHFFSKSEPVSMHIEFVVNGAEPNASQGEPVCYRYDLVISDQAVQYERLRLKSSKLFSRVFERQLVDGHYKVQGLGEKLVANLRKNVSWLSWVAQHNLPEAVTIVQYFKQFKSNLGARGPRMPGLYNTLGAIDVYRDDPALSVSMVQQLNRWDIDIEDVVYERIDGSDDVGSHWMAYCLHRLAGQEARLSILNESSGTIGLFSLMSIVLPVLREGGVAIIDEIEADLHPHMLRAILELFVQPDTNPHGAQLLFTSHADWLMNLVHKTQIFLVEKQNAASHVARLSDIRGVAARDNFSARYRAGSYGAVPEIN